MKRADFLKRQFATGGSSQLCTQEEAPSATPKATRQTQPMPIATPAPVDPAQALPGLHLSALELATGLERAFTHFSEMHPAAAENALAFVECINTAFYTAHPEAPKDGVEPILDALRSGAWAPSLTDLLDAGATQETFSFMPTGRAQLHIEPHEPISISTRSFQSAVECLAALPAESRGETLDALAKIECSFGGMLVAVEPWSEPEPRKHPEWISLVSREARTSQEVA